MKSLATVTRKEIGPHTRGGPMLDPKACLLARVAEPGHRPMRPLTRIARIHRAGVEGKLFAISNAELSDGRKLTDVLKSTLNGDGGICGDLVGSTPGSRDPLLKKTLDEIVLLLRDKEASLEKIMDGGDALLLRKSLGKAAKSIQDEIEQRAAAQAYLKWMNGEPRPQPEAKKSPSLQRADEQLAALNNIQPGGAADAYLPKKAYDRIDARGELLIIGHGV